MRPNLICSCKRGWSDPRACAQNLVNAGLVLFEDGVAGLSASPAKRQGVPDDGLTTRKHDVFISYSTRDRERAGAACAALEREGLRCWIAPRDGAPGVSYASFLVEAIGESRIVVLVFSQFANDSEAVLNKLEI